MFEFEPFQEAYVRAASYKVDAVVRDEKWGERHFHKDLLPQWGAQPFGANFLKLPQL